MRSAYIPAVLKHYYCEAIVFDRYPIVSEHKTVLDQLRRREVAAAPKSHEHLYRGMQHPLLKRSEKIENGTMARVKLDRFLELNTNLSVAYILKEGLRQLWSCVSCQELYALIESAIKQTLTRF